MRILPIKDILSYGASVDRKSRPSCVLSTNEGRAGFIWIGTRARFGIASPNQDKQWLNRVQAKAAAQAMLDL
jgi:hypothetical protein